MIRVSLVLIISFTFSCAIAQQMDSSATKPKVVKLEAVKAIPEREYQQNSVRKEVVSIHPTNLKLKGKRVGVSSHTAIPLSSKPNIALNQKKIITHNADGSKSMASWQNSKSKKTIITKNRVLTKGQIKPETTIHKTISKELMPLPSSTLDEKKKVNGQMKNTNTKRPKK